jgi:hypothetical protein
MQFQAGRFSFSITDQCRSVIVVGIAPHQVSGGGNPGIGNQS